MEFHPGKWQVIRIMKAKNPVLTNYLLHNHQLEVVTRTKYLGITISQDISWNKHMGNITSKVGKVLGVC